VRRICALSEIPDSGCLAFPLSDEGSAEGFFIYRQGLLKAYLNRCPHTGTTLNWQSDQFLDYEGEHIQCALHGALFRIDNGACIYGPCRGQGLEPVPVVLDGESLWLCEEDVPEAR
jgi:nitrite reductase/ring-hydroxylating ferredoxin subunit